MQSSTMTAAEHRSYSGKQKTRGSKYRNKPEHTEDGYFASQKELKRWNQLKQMRKAGIITGLQRQVIFDLAGVRYIADYVYFEIATKQFIVEDAKGFKTPEYKNKKTLMKNLLNIEIREV